ncbi:Major Facilitator Superfamily protein [Lentzea fradiae]|uniref:Major Facilitator Superfamily protein n=1 Tax=Lentzea fradiae TaxID=200378 RepID=A0A1G7VI65_9PSEU|nr:MFS transporter [Lentzea fradiae]SDG59505.1 Major Facilitator Superfamily protein [Lentzea fradiae]
MLRQFSVPAGTSRQLVLASLLMSAGNGAFLTCSAIYFTRVAGLSPAQLGLGLTVAGAVGLFAGVPLGHLADRRGPREVAAALVALNGVAAAAYLFVREFWTFVLVAAVFVLAERGSRAAIQALTSGLLGGDELVRIRAVVRSVNNVGVAVGTLVAGVALQIGTAPALSSVLVLDALSFLGSAAVLARLGRVAPTPPAAAGEPKHSVLRDGPFALFTALSGVLALHTVLLEIAVPLWIVTHTEAPAVMVTVLFLVNTISVVLFQVRVATRLNTLDRSVKGFRLAGFALLGACGLFSASSAGSAVFAAIALVAAGLVHVCGEMLAAAAAWTTSYGLAPADRQGQYQGFFFTGYAASMMVAPALTLLLVQWGTPGWWVLGGLFVSTALAMGPAVAWAQRVAARRQVSPAPV